MFIKRILQFAGTSVVAVTAVLFSIHSGPASAQRPVSVSYTHLTLPTIYSV